MRTKSRQYIAYTLLACCLGALVPVAYHFLHQDKILSSQGEKFFLEGRYADAVQRLSQAIALGDTRRATLLRLGEAYLASGDLQQALPIFSRIAMQEPQNAAATFKLAELYAITNNTDKALALVDRILAAHPGDKRARAMRGRILTIAGRFDDAIREYALILNENEQELRK